MNLWLLIIIIGITTLLFRASFLAILGEGSIPPSLQRALRFVPAAVFPAITMPTILYLEGSYAFALDNFRIYAALVAGLVAYRTRNLTFTMLAGLATLGLLQTLLS